MTRVQANLLLLLAAAIWGGGFVAQATAMERIGPFWFVGIRFMIAALAVLPFALLEARKHQQPITSKSYGGLMLVGVALFGGAITQQIGLLTTTVTNSSFLTGLYVIFVPIISVVALRRYPHWAIWPGGLMAACGIFFLSGGHIDRLVIGDMWSISCAFFWGIQIVMAGYWVGRLERPLALSTIQFAVCGGLSMLCGLVLEPISLEVIRAAAPELLYVGLISSGVAFVLQVVAQRYTTAPQAAIFLSSEALFGALLGALLLGETLPPTGYIGCALVFAAMLTVELVPELLSRRNGTKATQS